MGTERAFLPNSDRVLLKLKAAEEKIGSIYAPESVNRDECRIAEVWSVGDGRPMADGSLFRPPFESGDVVIVDSIGGLNVTIDGEKFLLVRCEEILGKFY